MTGDLTNRGQAAQFAAMTFFIFGILLVISASSSARDEYTTALTPTEACAGDNGGITLPAGFCATVFADNVGHARHLVVAPNGVVYVNTWSSRYYGNDTPPAGGFLVALQDTTGDGRADVNVRFGESVQSGSAGGTGIALYHGALFAEVDDRIMRYALPEEVIAPTGAPEVIVSGLPLTGDHPMHPFTIDAWGGCSSTSVPPPTPARSRTACPTPQGLSRARSWRRGPASGSMTPTGPGSASLPPSASPAVFPAHWAPKDLLLYEGHQFPAAYRGGAFIAFHGSWNRAPFPQGGYNVVFQPLAGGKPYGKYVIFADGFAGAVKEPGNAAHRPAGLAVGPDGALYIADDAHGRIWRVIFRGGTAVTGIEPAPTPSAVTSAVAPVQEIGPPEGIHPNAGAEAASTLPTPTEATPAQVTLGDRVFHGQVGGATCVGCHGSDAKGTPLGPNLTGGKWLWGDGSLSAITQTITERRSWP